MKSEYVQIRTVFELFTLEDDQSEIICSVAMYAPFWRFF